MDDVYNMLCLCRFLQHHAPYLAANSLTCSLLRILVTISAILLDQAEHSFHDWPSPQEVKMVLNMINGSKGVEDIEGDERDAGTKTLTHPALLSQAAQAAAAAAKMDRCVQRTSS